MLKPHKHTTQRTVIPLTPGTLGVIVGTTIVLSVLVTLLLRSALS